MHKYELEVEHDGWCENPNVDNTFLMVSFNRNHINFAHPDTLNPANVLATLSYYEHGLCRWMVGPSTVPDPYGGFDTVDAAGAIVWNDDGEALRDDDRAWFDDQTDEEKRKTLKAVAKRYTAWANGECYHYTFSEVSYCGECNAKHLTELDSCGGLVGDDEFNEYVNSEILYGIDPADVKVTGEASFIVTLSPVQVSA